MYSRLARRLPKQSGEMDELEHVEEEARHVADQEDDHNCDEDQGQVQLAVRVLPPIVQQVFQKYIYQLC